MTWQNFWMRQKRAKKPKNQRSDSGNHTGNYPAVEEETEVKKEEKTGMNVKGLGAIVLAVILGVAGIAVYKKHGRGKEEDYVANSWSFLMDRM